MAHPSHQQYADLAKDAYNDREVTREGQTINIGGNEYKVLAVGNDPKTGYHGTVYQDLKTNDVIVAHRGTEGLTTDWKDAITDAEMVLNRKNGQAQAAVNLTKIAMEKLDDFHNKNPRLPKPTLTHTGHSLGGALAQICAHYYGHHGVTFNAYGAASLGRIPQGGNEVLNYVKASDPVAAASPHYGKVAILATQDEIQRLRVFGYSNSTLANTVLPTAEVSAAAASVGTAHTIDNFTGRNSILSHPESRRLADENKVMIDTYRNEVDAARTMLNLPQLTPVDIYNHFTPRPAGEPAQKSLPPLTQAPDISQPLHKDASGDALTAFGFAALLADDGEMRDRAINNLMATDAAKQFEQDGMQAALDYDMQQAALKPRGPVMTL